jgi:hypothetical protein
MRDLNIRQRLLAAFVFSAFLSLFLGGISYYTIRLLNNNLRSSSTELKSNVETELSTMHAQNAVSDMASRILSSSESRDLKSIDPAQTIAELEKSGAKTDASIEKNLTDLYQAKVNYLTTRETLDANMAVFMEQSQKLSTLVGESVNAVREETVAKATKNQQEISAKTDTTTSAKLTELSKTASSTLNDTVLVLQVRGKVLELEVEADSYLRAPAKDKADKINKTLSEIGESFGKIPENVAGAFEVAEMNTLRDKAAGLLTGKDGIVNQAVPSPQSVASLQQVLADLDSKLLELADNTVFDGSNNLTNYLQQVSGDLGKSLGTLIQTQKEANTSLNSVSQLQLSTASIKETLDTLLILVQDASLKCTDKSVKALRSQSGKLIGQLDADKSDIVATLTALGKQDMAAQIDKGLGDIVKKANGQNGIVAQTLKAADAYNSSLAANSAINASLTNASKESTNTFRDFTDRITTTMQEKVSEGGAWMKVQLVLVAFIFAAAIGLGLWIGASVSKRLSEAVVQLFGLSQKLSASSAAITESSEEQATMASEQAASLEESSSTIEEISSMAARNNDAVREATKISTDVLGATDEGARKMTSMSHTIDDMNNASAQISKIIKAIDEIAFQTNILALNAAVEAARAGEAGAGFAVVADEVRSLALKCKTAAQETEQIIARNTTLTQEGVKMCSSVADSLSKIRERITCLDTLVKEISQASQEQTTGLNQINQALATTSSATQKNAALAQQGASSAQELIHESSNLIETIDDLSRLSGISMDGSGSHTSLRIQDSYEDEDRQDASGDKTTKTLAAASRSSDKDQNYLTS